MSKRPNYCEVVKREKDSSTIRFESVISDDILGVILSNLKKDFPRDQANSLLVNKTWNRVGWKNMEFSEKSKFKMVVRESSRMIVKLMTNPSCDLRFSDDCMVISAVTWASTEYSKCKEMCL